MNDFTKEELEKLRSAITNYDYCDDKLHDKLQSLIDNYCEHQETENIGGWVWKCVKCGMKFGDETQ